MIKTLTKLSIIALTVASTSSYANIWREIEIVVFQQLSGQENLRETFPVDITPVNITKTGDFISPLLQPDVKALRDGLPICFSDMTSTATSSINSGMKNPDENESLPAMITLLDENDPLLTQPLKIEADSGFRFSSDGNDFNANEKNQYANDKINLDGTDDSFQSDHSAINESEPTTLAPLEFTFKNPTTTACVFEEELDLFANDNVSPTQIAAASVPESFFAATETEAQGLAYVMPENYSQLKEVVRNIKNSRNMRVMLHTVWRQNIEFGRKAKQYRVFAGDNYSDRFEYSGLPTGMADAYLAQQQVQKEQNQAQQIMPEIYDHDAFMAQIKEAIATAGPHVLQTKSAPETSVELPQHVEGQPQETWQLDGKYNLYLKLVGRTPYMFIDWDMDYRQIGEMPEKYRPLLALNEQSYQQDEMSNIDQQSMYPDNYLYAYKFQQSRRLISGEVHYFDHPYFGIMMQIRRYTSDQDDESQDE